MDIQEITDDVGLYTVLQNTKLSSSITNFHMFKYQEARWSKTFLNTKQLNQSINQILRDQKIPQNPNSEKTTTIL